MVIQLFTLLSFGDYRMIRNHHLAELNDDWLLIYEALAVSASWWWWLLFSSLSIEKPPLVDRIGSDESGAMPGGCSSPRHPENESG